MPRPPAVVEDDDGLDEEEGRAGGCRALLFVEGETGPPAATCLGGGPKEFGSLREAIGMEAPRLSEDAEELEPPRGLLRRPFCEEESSQYLGHE